MITDYIPEGYKNRVSREYLREILNDDRGIRREIAESPVVIIHNDGYFIPVDEDDLIPLEEYIRRETARASAIYERVKRAREIYFNLKG